MGLLQRLESSGVATLVGVVPQAEVAVGALDLGLGGVHRDPKHCVGPVGLDLFKVPSEHPHGAREQRATCIPARLDGAEVLEGLRPRLALHALLTQLQGALKHSCGAVVSAARLMGGTLEVGHEQLAPGHRPEARVPALRAAGPKLKRAKAEVQLFECDRPLDASLCAHRAERLEEARGG